MDEQAPLLAAIRVRHAVPTAIDNCPPSLSLSALPFPPPLVSLSSFSLLPPQPSFIVEQTNAPFPYVQTSTYLPPSMSPSPCVVPMQKATKEKSAVDETLTSGEVDPPLLAPSEFEIFDPLDADKEAKKKYIRFAQSLLGEVLGTCAVVSVTCGFPAGDLWATALMAAFFIVALIHALIPVSGAHFNPIITVCLCLSKRMPIMEGLWYIFSQLIGGCLGALCLRLLVPERFPSSVSRYPSTSNLGRAFLGEVILSSILVFVAYASSVSNRSLYKKFAPLPIGCCIFALIIVGASISGPSMNPVRSIGPAVVAGDMKDLWIYIVGPMLGALIGWFWYQVIFSRFFIFDLVHIFLDVPITKLSIFCQPSKT